MKLNEAKKVFHAIRRDENRVFVDEHAYADYPDRKFTEQEVIKLISNTKGQFQDTDDSDYLGKRFFWRTKDLSNRWIRIVLELDKDEEGNFILAISAWRHL